MEWWVWLVFGLLLVAIEVFTPGGFFILFFGIAALSVGALAATSLPYSTSLPVQIVTFLLISIVGLILFRNALVARFGRVGRGREVDSLLDSVATAIEDLAPGAMGKVELRGSTWAARNSGGVPVTRGQRCAVERVDGLTLWVRVAADEYLAALPRKEPVT